MSFSCFSNHCYVFQEGRRTKPCVRKAGRGGNGVVKKLCNDEIIYLNKRTQFWKQQRGNKNELEMSVDGGYENGSRSRRKTQHLHSIFIEKLVTIEKGLKTFQLLTKK